MMNVTWNFAILRFWRTIPVQLIVVAPLFLVMGGGYTVIIAVLYSIAADVESDAHRFVDFRPGLWPHADEDPEHQHSSSCHLLSCPEIWLEHFWLRNS
jgi:hypothetical protein